MTIKRIFYIKKAKVTYHYFDCSILIITRIIILYHPNCHFKLTLETRKSVKKQTFRSSLRPISDSQLHALPHFHLCPIHLIVFQGSYALQLGYLILGGASRLDAFSVYPFQTWLLGHAPGGTTDTPVVRPSRSSRTKDGSLQISYARAG